MLRRSGSVTVNVSSGSKLTGPTVANARQLYPPIAVEPDAAENEQPRSKGASSKLMHRNGSPSLDHLVWPRSWINSGNLTPRACAVLSHQFELGGLLNR